MRRLFKVFPKTGRFLKTGIVLLFSFSAFFTYYVKRRLLNWSSFFETHKNTLVKFFLMKRGRYNRPFLHVTAMVVMVIGVIIAPFLADTYPVFSKNSLSEKLSSTDEEQQSITLGENVFETNISQKPRDTVITYTIQNGDTISSIGQKFSVSQETIKWANDLISDDLTVGDELEILPVSGIVHKVAKGDNVYTIAKKYDTEAQKIVDFPFNDFSNPETFSLIEGQTLIVPDGIKPSERSTYKRPVYLAKGPTSTAGSAVGSYGFAWPLQGVISQFAAWYHMGIDITSPVGTPIVAASSGTVSTANVGTWDGGYGTNILVSDGGSFQTLYAHLSGVNVSVGDSVVAGKTVIGWVGLTGRTTGAHLHFEIRRDGALVNPMAYLQ